MVLWVGHRDSTAPVVPERNELSRRKTAHVPLCRKKKQIAWYLCRYPNGRKVAGRIGVHYMKRISYHTR